MLSLSSSSSSTGTSAFKRCGSNCPQSLLDFTVPRARHFRICSLTPTGPSTSARRSSDRFGPGGRDADLHLSPLALTLIAGVSIFTSISCAMLALSKSLCRRLHGSGSTSPGRRTSLTIVRCVLVDPRLSSGDERTVLLPPPRDTLLSPCADFALQLSLPHGAHRPYPSAVLGLV